MRDGGVITDASSVAYDAAFNANVYNVGVVGEKHQFSVNDGAGSRDILFEISLASINALSKKIINVSDPTLAQDVATKAYVDSVISGGDAWSDPIDSAITTDGTPRAVGTSGNRLGNTFLTNLDVNTITVSGLSALNGDVSLGNTSGDTVNVNGKIGTNVDMDQNDIDNVNVITIENGSSGSIATITGVNDTVDELEINLASNIDYRLELAGSIKQHFDASANEMLFDGCQTLRSAERFNVPEVSINPPTPPSGQVTIFAFSSGGTDEVRAKNSNGDVITLGAFP